MALALVFFLLGAFILIPGGCAFLLLGTVSLMAALALMGAVLLMTASKEFTFATLQLQLLAFFCKVFSSAIEALVVAALGGLDVHVLGSLVLALSTIPDLIKFRSCFLFLACFKSFLKSQQSAD